MNLAMWIIVAGIILLVVGFLGDMDIIPKFSQWEGIPLNIIGFLLILGGVAVAIFSKVKVSAIV